MEPITKRIVGRWLIIAGGTYLVGALLLRSKRHLLNASALASVVAGSVLVAMNPERAAE